MKSLYQANAESIDVMAFAWQYRRKMLGGFCVGIALTLAYLSLAPRSYESEAKLFVRIGRESATLDPTATTGQFISVADTRESEVHAVEELLESRALAEKVVDEFTPHVILGKDPNRPGLNLSGRLSWLNGANLNPLRVYSLRDKAINALQEELNVAAASKTSVVSVSYDAEDPKLAQDVLTSLLKFARDQHLQTHRTSGSQEFFVEQAKLLKTHLAELERQLRDLKSATGLASLPTQRELQLELVDSLKADLVRAQAEQKAAQAEVEHRRLGLKDMPALIIKERMTGAPQNGGQTMREKLYDLEVKEQELAANVTPNHPLLVHLRDQIGEARQIAKRENISEQVTKGLNESRQTSELAVQEREATLASLAARTQSLQATIADVTDELKKLNDSELEINRLEREIELARASYVKYSENLEQARINQELEDAKISSLNFMQAPTFSETPVSPKPIVTLAVGFVASVMCGVGVGLVAHFRPRRKPPSASVPATEPTILPPSTNANFGRHNEAIPTNPR
jgi:uncharacterized protein involved in exopolysaccharide biosynthesis